MLHQAVGSGEEEEEELAVGEAVEEGGVALLDVAKVGEDPGSIFDPDLFTSSTPGRSSHPPTARGKAKTPGTSSRVSTNLSTAASAQPRKKSERARSRSGQSSDGAEVERVNKRGRGKGR